MKGKATIIAFTMMLLLTGVAQAQELKPGDVLSEKNWQLAKDLLPPEILRHYERGEFANPVVEWKNGLQRWSKAFVESSQRNPEHLVLDAKGSIVDKATGQRPDYICGFPFPTVGADDPQEPRQRARGRRARAPRGRSAADHARADLHRDHARSLFRRAVRLARRDHEGCLARRASPQWARRSHARPARDPHLSALG